MRKVFQLIFFLSAFINNNSFSQQAGTLDTSFGNGGKVITMIPGLGTNNPPQAIAVQPDGKIVVCGILSHTSYYTQFLIRYEKDGSIDSTFGIAGIDTFPLVQTNYFYDSNPKIAIQFDGKIIGTSCRGMFRCLPDGSLDSTFGINGISLEGIGSSFLVLPNEKILVTREELFMIRRLNNDGSMDTTFGTGGNCYKTFYPNIQELSGMTDLSVDDDGKIFVSGFIGGYDAPETYYDYAFARIDSTGFFDNTYGFNGVNTFGDLIHWEKVWSFVGLPDRHISSATDYDQNTIDQSVLFGIDNSTVPTDIYFGHNKIALQQDKKILFIGSLNAIHNDLAVVRYNSIGIDSSFSDEGIFSLDVDSMSNDDGWALAIQTDGKILAEGITDSSIFIIRLLNCGATADKNIPCNNFCNGSINLSPFGSSPFSYQWSNGETDSTLDSLCAGNYSVVITDSSGCIATYTFDLTLALNASISSLPASCSGFCDGSATAMPVGGTPPYSYLWINGDTNKTAFNLCAGNYSYYVTDANQCLDSISIPVFEPTQLMITSTAVHHPTCSGCNDGYIVFNASGGTPPYTINWFPNTGQLNGDSITGLEQGIYQVSLTDANNCSFSITDTLTDQPDFVLDLNSENNFLLFPNPAMDKMFIEFLDQGYKSILIFNALGEKILEQTSIGMMEIINIEPFSEGVYFISVMSRGNLKRQMLIIN